MRADKGISILEYAILISVLLLALFAMQNYLRRAISHKWREAADVYGGGRQYESQGAKATQVVP